MSIAQAILASNGRKIQHTKIKNDFYVVYNLLHANYSNLNSIKHDRPNSRISRCQKTQLISKPAESHRFQVNFSEAWNSRCKNPTNCAKPFSRQVRIPCSGVAWIEISRRSVGGPTSPDATSGNFAMLNTVNAHLKSDQLPPFGFTRQSCT